MQAKPTFWFLFDKKNSVLGILAIRHTILPNKHVVMSWHMYFCVMSATMCYTLLYIGVFMNMIHSFCEGRDLCPKSIKKVLPKTEARVPGTLRSVLGRTRLCPREGCCGYISLLNSCPDFLATIGAIVFVDTVSHHSRFTELFYVPYTINFIWPFIERDIFILICISSI